VRYDRRVDLNEIDAWTVSQRRAAALRLLGSGLVLLVPAAAWLGFGVDWDAERLISRDRAMAAMIGVIGACLAVVGAYSLTRVRVGIDPAVPTATARTPGP
jgi:hypothetical protein